MKTQELYLLVFVTRYLDLFTSFHSLYNTLMKIFYIAASGAIVYAFYRKEPWRSTYITNTKPKDIFPHWLYAVLPCFVISIFINEGTLSSGFFSYCMDCLWAFSIYLEAIAIIPQLIMLMKDGSAENITSWYMFSLGSYRALYLLNWIYRYLHEPGYSAWIVWLSGLLQTGLYADFFYYFIQAKYHGKSYVLLPQ